MNRYGTTKRQDDCFAAILAYRAEHGRMPSLGELRERLGLKSKSGVGRLLDGLAERGLIRRLAYRSRAIAVVAGREPGNAASASVSVIVGAALFARLQRHCARNGDDLHAAVNDAIALMLDDAGPRVSRETAEAMVAGREVPVIA